MAPRTPHVVMVDPANFTPYYVHSLCVGLSDLGVRPRVITSPPLFEPTDTAGRYDVEWRFFPGLTGRLGSLLRRHRHVRRLIKAMSYPVGLWRTWLGLRRCPAGVLHLQWAVVPPLDSLLLRALRARGWAIVYTAHDPLPDAGKPAAFRRSRALLVQVDHVIVHTPGLARRLIATYPEAATKVRVIPHGGRVYGRPSAAAQVDARRALGVPGSVPVLLFFGMIKPYKGLKFLLEAMPLVLAAFPEARLVIAGEPLMPLAPFERQIEHLGIGRSVVLRPSFVPDREVGRYFAAADLLVAPHLEVGASGVVFTAQSYGLPVVATQVGGLPEIVAPIAGGFLAAPGSAAALAAAICRALSDPEELSELGRRAAEKLGRENDWTDVARSTLALYARAMR